MKRTPYFLIAMPKKPTPPKKNNPKSPAYRRALHRAGTIWRRWWRTPWFKWPFLTLSSIVLLVIAVIVISYVAFPPVKDYNFGVSFSEKRARELGVDPRANFTALLDDLEIRTFRLMSYWDEHEKERGRFDFSALDWQMDEAAKRGAKVSLAIGLRQPRWPECHQPAWANDLKGHEWKQALYAYMEVVIKRYENHPALESWQLENESFNEWFGDCDLPDRTRIQEELALVKRLSKKPVWMSLSDQHGLPWNGPPPDAYGYSIYRFTYSSQGLLQDQYIWYPTPVWYHRLRAELVKLRWNDIPLFIHELQLEPWGPDSTEKLSVEEQNRSMSVDQIRQNTYFARQVGFKDIYTWGGEWWYWRKEKFGDYSMWDAIKREIEASRDGR